jgi:uroporphyrinogen-III synthase
VTLSGTTVLVTRPRDSDSALPRALRRAGARVVWEPVIQIDEAEPTPALDAALQHLERYEWIVWTSVHGVSAFWRRAAVLGCDRGLVQSRKIAAVGPATARAIERSGLDVTLIGYPYSADGLVETMTSLVHPGTAVLYPRAADARPTLVDGLRRIGADVTEVVAYRAVPAPASPAMSSALASGVDCIVFCSPSAVRAVLPHRAAIERSTIACIGPTTAGAARAAGLDVHIVPRQATAFALADAVIAHFGRAGS